MFFYPKIIEFIDVIPSFAPSCWLCHFHSHQRLVAELVVFPGHQVSGCGQRDGRYEGAACELKSHIFMHVTTCNVSVYLYLYVYMYDINIGI